MMMSGLLRAMRYVCLRCHDERVMFDAAVAIRYVTRCCRMPRY